MNETTKKITDKIIHEFVPVGEQLRKEGFSDYEIVSAFNSYADKKRKDFYHKKYNAIGSTITAQLEKLIGVNADSKSEMLFYNELVERGVPFVFQVGIGPYRADYIIGDQIVFEGDGPHHTQQKAYDKKRDKYIKSLGYDVIRMRWSVVAIAPNVVVDEIISLLKSRRPRLRLTEKKGGG